MKVTMGGAERARGGGGAAGGGRARTRRGRGRGGEGARGEHGAGAGSGCARGAARGVGSVRGRADEAPSASERLIDHHDVDPAKDKWRVRKASQKKAAPCKKYRLLYDSNLGRRFGAPARLAERFSTVDSGCVARGDSPIARRGPTASSLVVRTK